PSPHRLDSPRSEPHSRVERPNAGQVPSIRQEDQESMLARPLRAPTRRRRLLSRLSLEVLESRCLLSTDPWAGVSLIHEVENNDTRARAQPMGQRADRAQVAGAMGDSPAGAADVDWYQFTLARPARVTLSAGPSAGAAGVVLGLYNDDSFDYGD